MSDYLLWLLCDADEMALQAGQFGQCVREHVTLEMVTRQGKQEATREQTQAV